MKRCINCGTDITGNKHNECHTCRKERRDKERAEAIKRMNAPAQRYDAYGNPLK
jgi:hypothetical protein